MITMILREDDGSTTRLHCPSASQDYHDYMIFAQHTVHYDCYYDSYDDSL